MKRLLMLMVMLGLMISMPALLLAQDLSQTYSSPDGRFSMNYPAGWINQVGTTFGVGFFNSENAKNSGFSSQEPGDATFFIIPSDATTTQSFGSTPQEILSNFTTLFSGGAASSEGTASEIAGKPALSAEAADSFFIAVLDLGDGSTLTALGFTAPGELSTFEPQFLAMLNSLQFSAVPATAVPVELNLQPITVENAAQLAQIWTVNIDRSCFNAGSFSPDGHQIAACDLRKNLTLLDSSTGNTLQVLSTGQVTEDTVAYRTLFSPDGQTVAAAEGRQTLLLHNITSGTDATVQLDQATSIVDMAFNADGSKLAYITGNPGMVGVVGSDGTVIQTNPLEAGYDGANIAYSPTGDTLLYTYGLGFGDTPVALWDVAQNQLISTSTIQGAPLGAYFLPDGKPIAVTIDYDTNNVLVWDVAASAKISELSGHTDVVVRVALSPDGTLLATASNDTTVRIWDIQSGKQLASLPHEYTDLRVSFSPDSRMVLTSDQLGNTFLWGVQ